MPRTEQAPTGTRPIAKRIEQRPFSAAVDALLVRAELEASAAESPLLETAHVVLAAFSGDAVVSRLLRSLIDETSLRAVLAEKGVKVMK